MDYRQKLWKKNWFLIKDGVLQANEDLEKCTMQKLLLYCRKVWRKQCFFRQTIPIVLFWKLKVMRQKRKRFTRRS